MYEFPLIFKFFELTCLFRGIVKRSVPQYAMQTLIQSSYDAPNGTAGSCAHMGASLSTQEGMKYQDAHCRQDLYLIGECKLTCFVISPSY